MGGRLIDDLINAILGRFAGLIVAVLDLLWGLLAATVFVAPTVTALPQVRAVAGTSLAVVNTGYVLAFVWTRMVIMGRDTSQSPTAWRIWFRGW